MDTPQLNEFKQNFTFILVNDPLIDATSARVSLGIPEKCAHKLRSRVNESASKVN